MDENDENSEVVAYVTKWALTEGIIKVSGRLTKGGYFTTNSEKLHVFASKKEYALTIEEAEAQVLDKARRKLKSMDKQRAKLNLIVVSKGQVPVKTR